MEYSFKRKNTRRGKSMTVSENTDSDFDKKNPIQTEELNCCGNCCTPLKTEKLLHKKWLNSNACVKQKNSKSQYLEEVEMKVLNEELIERELNNKQFGSRQQMEDVTELLRIISMYAQCLDTKQKLTLRFQHVLKRMGLIKNGVKLINELSHSLDFAKFLADCNEDVITPEYYYDLVYECSDRYREFTKASTYFCRILQNSEMTNGQLRKLEKHYEEIRAGYSECKKALNAHTDRLIESRSILADKHLQILAPVILQSMESDKEISNIINDLSLPELINVIPDRKTSSKTYKRVVGQDPALGKCCLP